jgi:hypothetical protein
VRQASLNLLGELYQQLGPILKSLIQSESGLSESLKTQIDKKLESYTFDSSAASTIRSKKTLIVTESDGEVKQNTLGIEIPKSDLVASLSTGCLKRMVSCEFFVMIVLIFTF